MMDKAQPPKKKNSATLLGLAFDGDDGQKRITRGSSFFLAGGSQETHVRMQETALKVNERLKRKGKQLQDVSLGELRDILSDVATS